MSATMSVMTSAAAWRDPSRGAAGAVPARPGRMPRPRLVLVPTGDAVAGEAAGADRAALPGGLRITRLGRLVLSGLTLAVALVIGVFALSGVTSAAPATAPAPRVVVTVEAGQTLSEIAATRLPGEHLADAVARIQIANNLSTSEVSAGQRLVIPTT